MSDLSLCTTIIRDGYAQDVTVNFSATCVNPGYRATRSDPGEGPEFECLFEGAELDCPEDDEGPLTEPELATLRTWFVTKGDAAHEAANDNMERGR